MGVNTQPEGDLFALLIAEHSTLGATMTATTQAGPKPGGCTADRDSPLALFSVGELDDPISTTSALADIQVTTQEAGQVGRATVRWGYTGASAPYSWDPPVLITGWEFIDRSATANQWKRPHVARIPSTGRVIASVTKTSSQAVAWRQDRFGKWFDAVVATTGAATVSCVVPLSTKNGRIACLYIRQTSSTSSQIRMSYSDDSGATWTLGSSACLKTPLGKAGASYKRIRAVELHGLLSVLLWEQDTTDTIYQYVSSDQGASLDLVETFSSAAKACPDMTVHAGVLYIATIEYDAARAASTLAPYVRVLSSASLPLSSVDAVDAGDVADLTEWGNYAVGVIDAAECAMFADDDGVLWLYGVDHDVTATWDVATRSSRDGGLTWTHNFDGTHVPSGTVLYKGDASTYLRDLTVAPERGRAVLLHTSQVNAATDDSLCAAYVGGWSNVGMAEDDDLTTGANVAGWDHVWLPIDLPTDSGAIWTVDSFGGTGAAALGDRGLTLSTGDATHWYTYTAAPSISSSAEDGILDEVHVTLVSGTAQHRVRISDGVNDYEVSVTLTATTAELRDINTGLAIDSLAIDGTAGVVLRVALEKGTGVWSGNTGVVRAWARVDGPYSGSLIDYGPRAVRAWEQIGTSSTLVSSAETTTRVSWGVTGVSEAIFRRVAYSAGAYTAGNVSSSLYGTQRGCTLPGAASPIHLTEGLQVYGIGGPTVVGDSWTHRVAYEHPVEAVDPSRFPSPRRTHRTTSVAIDHDIAWTGMDIGWRAGDMLGILAVGVNFPQANLYRDLTGANHVSNLDFRIQSLAFSRSRGQIIPVAGGSAAPFHFSEGSLRGAHVNLGAGVIRKVRGNQAGAWLSAGAAGDYPSARVQLDAYDAGDAASGSLDLWMPGGFFITEAMLSTDTLMLRTTKHPTTEGYFEYGVLMIGRVRILKRPAWGRSLQWTPAYALNTSPSGARTARSLGPVGRSVEIAWDDGVETTAIHTAGVAPDWYTAGYSGADAIAAPADTPRTLGGILTDADGARLPVGYLPAIQQFAAAPTAAAPYRDLDPHGWLYGRILTETLRMDTHLGDEQRNEYVKGGLVRFEEER